MQFFAQALLAISLTSTVNAASCTLDKDLMSLGPYSEPTIELSAVQSNELMGMTSANSFSVDVAGVGQASGTTFTVPAFSQANVSIALAVPALTSMQVRNLRDSWEAILNATQRESLLEYEQQDITASRNLAFLGWFGGGKNKRSSSAVRSNFQSRGLSTDQIGVLIGTFTEIASAMSSVQLEFTIFNQNNPYSVSGNILIWTMSGTITSVESEPKYCVSLGPGNVYTWVRICETTVEKQTQFRVLSDGGIATGGQGNANAAGDVIPLVL